MWPTIHVEYKYTIQCRYKQVSLVVTLFQLRTPGIQSIGDATFNLDFRMLLLCLCYSMILLTIFQVIFWTCVWGLSLFVFQSHKTLHAEDATQTPHWVPILVLVAFICTADLTHVAANIIPGDGNLFVMEVTMDTPVLIKGSACHSNGVDLVV